MTKFSSFINDLGSARDPTIRGIESLGFIRSSDLPTILGSFVRVDASQSFNPSQTAMARSNIGAVIGLDVQAFSTKLENISSATMAADTLLYSTGAETFAVTAFTSTGRDIVAALDPAGARDVIGLGDVDNTSDEAKPVSLAQQSALNLKANVNSPALTGTPTAPTAAAGTNTTQLATTEFVQAALAALPGNDPWGSFRVGQFYVVDTSISGVEIPPSATSGTTVWIQLTAGLTGSGQFNEGKLTGESVSGSFPLVTATATVSLTGSPINGETVNLINTERRFLRAGSAGTVENDQMQGHYHESYGDGINAVSGSVQVPRGTMGTPQASGIIRDPITDGVNGTPRAGTETRPKNIGVTYFMRIA